jgi:hypothetical protein
VSHCTIEQEYDIIEEIGTYVQVIIGKNGASDMLHAAILDINHRVQVLHGMACGHLTNALYVVASTTGILRVVHIFDEYLEFSKRYIAVMNDLCR